MYKFSTFFHDIANMHYKIIIQHELIKKKGFPTLPPIIKHGEFTYKPLLILKNDHVTLLCLLTSNTLKEGTEKHMLSIYSLQDTDELQLSRCRCGYLIFDCNPDTGVSIIKSKSAMTVFGVNKKYRRQGLGTVLIGLSLLILMSKPKTTRYQYIGAVGHAEKVIDKFHLYAGENDISNLDPFFVASIMDKSMSEHGFEYQYV